MAKPCQLTTDQLRGARGQEMKEAASVGGLYLSSEDREDRCTEENESPRERSRVPQHITLHGLSPSHPGAARKIQNERLFPKSHFLTALPPGTFPHRQYARPCVQFLCLAARMTKTHTSERRTHRSSRVMDPKRRPAR